jgi:uncharacterized protein
LSWGQAVIAERTERFERWVAPMAASAAPHRLALGLALAGGVWFAVVALVLRLAAAAGFAPGRGLVVVYLLTFAVLLVGVGVVMRRLHGLPGARLLGPEERLDLGGVGRGIGFVLAVVAVLALPMFLFEPPTRQHALAFWALWLPAALPALFVQATVEEVVFRGYLQGMLASRFASRLAWWVLPALLFGLLHWSPGLGENAWLMAAAATLMGLALGDVAARSGGLSLPIGLHFANNAVAMLLVATPSPLSGLALYLSPIDPDDPAAMRTALLGNMTLVAILWAGYVLIDRWRRRR